MKPDDVFRAAARCWERAGDFYRAAERYARANAWADSGRCWAQAGRFVDAANAYARAGEPISEARQWLASPRPERARGPYRQALEMGLSTAAKVEALLGLGEIELASEQAFAVAPENGRPVEALRSLARIAAARGRPDLAARAWSQAVAVSPESNREVFEGWERALPWNRSLGWGRPQAGVPGWPSRAFHDVRLEIVWEERLGSMMYGNRALAWSTDGSRFAAAEYEEGLVLGKLTGKGVRYQSVEMMGAISVAFIPESDSVLVGCNDGQVALVDASGSFENVDTLELSGSIYAITFSLRGDRVAVTAGSSSQAFLSIWAWDSQGPREILREEQTQEQDIMNPSCVWSPDGRTLAWCPGPWKEETVPNDVHLFSDTVSRCVSTVHKNGINGIAFSPDGLFLITASNDRTLALRDAQTGEVVTPPWNCAQRLETVCFHPHAALLAAGGTDDFYGGYQSPSRLYLFRFSQTASYPLKVIQKNATETAVCSLAFSPDGEHLLMSTDDRLTLFRVYLLI